MKQDGMNSQYHLIFCFIRLQLGKNFLPQLDCNYASFFRDIWKPVVITEDQTSGKICIYIHTTIPQPHGYQNGNPGI